MRPAPGMAFLTLWNGSAAKPRCSLSCESICTLRNKPLFFLLFLLLFLLLKLADMLFKCLQGFSVFQGTHLRECMDQPAFHKVSLFLPLAQHGAQCFVPFPKGDGAICKPFSQAVGNRAQALGCIVQAAQAMVTA